MADTKGWIKLYRQSADNSLYFSEPFDKWHAWTDLLLMVNHEQKQFFSKGQLLVLEPGQTVTSIPILAERWQWSENKVRRFIRLLCGSGMCTRVGSPNGTLITITNWAKYQSEGQTNGRGDGRADGSSDGRADGTLTRSKEYKKLRIPRKSASDEAWEGFVEEMKRRGEWTEEDERIANSRIR